MVRDALDALPDAPCEDMRAFADIRMKLGVTK
jgi:hypothetical protein